MPRVHATALVDPKAELADDVEVGPYSIVGPHVRAAAGTIVGPHVVLTGRTRLGERNRLFQFTSIGEIPQDRKYGGEPTTTTIGDDNVFREFTTINAGTAQDRGDTRIGNANLFLAYTHVAHDCVIGNGTTFSNNAQLAGHVHIGDCVVMGAYFRRAPVLPGRRARDDCRGRDRAAGRSPRSSRPRIPGGPARHQCRRPAPAWLCGGGHPRDPSRLQDALSRGAHPRRRQGALARSGQNVAR
jgi:acetyltransferase-like isoleucine patch superfamily enzyme